MINEQLLNPQSIAIIGGSDDINKPGGKILFHISEYFRGDIFIVNRHHNKVQGYKAYTKVSEINAIIDLAVLAIPAKYCPETVQQLINQNHTRAFIIISAGFSEESKEGAVYEKAIVNSISAVNGCLIGPNCTGIITKNHQSYFTTPIPTLHNKGIDFISSSGSVAVFLIESAIKMGLRFNSVFSVGNAAQTGIEEVLEYMDETYHHELSSQNKLLYIEDIKKPGKLLKHASSLINKGCKIAAIKAGRTEAGKRAAQSHTGAMTSSDNAIDALFKKAGIIRCYSRLELATMGAIFSSKNLTGNKLAIITHAGGPAVLLTDTLSNGGFDIPNLSGSQSEELKKHLYLGSSVKNPIDFLATGTHEQLETIIDYCEHKFHQIDAMIVIFGSSGLFPVDKVYEVLDRKIKTCKKTIYAVLPSVANAEHEIDYFTGRGNICFFDEVIFGTALCKVHARKKELHHIVQTKEVNIPEIRKILTNTYNKSLSQAAITQLLSAANIKSVDQFVIHNINEIKDHSSELRFPLVAKVIGPLHKTEINGVSLNIKSIEELMIECQRLFKIKDTEGITIQPMLSGIELFIGAKFEPKFGHLLFIGVGGIFVEVIKDLSTGLAPLNKNEALAMIQQLKAYPLLKGYRQQPGIDINGFAEIIVRISTMLHFSKEIVEMDLNPLMATCNDFFVVDASIQVE